MSRSRRVPKRVYSDRGPEARNAVIIKILVLLGVDKHEGLPQQPIFQGAVERDYLGTQGDAHERAARFGPGLSYRVGLLSAGG